MLEMAQTNDGNKKRKAKTNNTERDNMKSNRIQHEQKNSTQRINTNLNSARTRMLPRSAISLARPLPIP